MTDQVLVYSVFWAVSSGVDVRDDLPSPKLLCELYVVQIRHGIEFPYVYSVLYLGKGCTCLQAGGGWLAKVTGAWQAGRINNLDYLLYCNLAAGRSFNDLTQVSCLVVVNNATVDRLITIMV